MNLLFSVELLFVTYMIMFTAPYTDSIVKYHVEILSFLSFPF